MDPILASSTVKQALLDGVLKELDAKSVKVLQTVPGGYPEWIILLIQELKSVIQAAKVASILGDLTVHKVLLVYNSWVLFSKTQQDSVSFAKALEMFFKKICRLEGVVNCLLFQEVFTSHASNQAVYVLFELI
jgi:hypothetical protein